MKKAAVLVSFGTSHEDARKSSLEAIYREISAVDSDIFVYQAYTSGMILDKISKENLYIDTVDEAVKKALDDGAEVLYVIPTHMIPGIEYQKMLGMLEKYRPDFQKIQVTTPILNSEADCKKLIPVLKEMLEFYDDYEYILMGHGSEDEANVRYAQMNQAFVESGFHNVRIASVEAKPDLDDAMAELENRKKKKKVILHPFMVVAGDHAKNDMAGEAESYVSKLREAGYETEVVIKGLGEYPQFRKIYVDKFITAQKSERESIRH